MPKLPLALVALLALSACQDHTHIARRDGVTSFAGDAVAHNKAIHVIDPWPAGSQNVRLETSGRRVADAIERYETRANAAAGAPPPGAGIAP